MKIPARKSRKDYYTAIVWLAVTGTLIFRIPFVRLTGDKGAAYFSMANEIYFAVAGALSYGISEAVAILVRYRTRRAQFKSAGKVFGNALCLGGILGLVLSLLVGFGGQMIAGGMFHVPLGGMAAKLMAPSIFFCIITGVFRGYFQGNGFKAAAMHSELLHMIFLLIGGMAGAFALHKYGLKVSALLQNDDYASAYGAMGACAGLLLASVLCFLHALVLYFILKRNISGQAGREGQKGQDSGFRIWYSLLGTGLVYGVYFLCFHMLPLLDQYLFFHSGQEGSVSQWGAYYGRCLVTAGIVSGLIHMVCLVPVKPVVAGMERGEQPLAKERLGILIHQCAVIAIPAAAFLAVMAESILDLLFKGDNHQTALWVQVWCAAIVFQVFASVFMEIFVCGRKTKIALGIGVIAMVVHGAVTMLLLKAAKLGILAIAVGAILFYVVVAVLGFLLVSRLYQYRQEWIRTFGITAIASAISGVAAMLLNKVLSSFAGTLISLIVGLLVGIVVYMVLLVVLRAFEDGELSEMAGGRVFMLLADLLHFA